MEILVKVCPSKSINMDPRVTCHVPRIKLLFHLSILSKNHHWCKLKWRLGPVPNRIELAVTHLPVYTWDSAYQHLESVSDGARGYLQLNTNSTVDTNEIGGGDCGVRTFQTTAPPCPKKTSCESFKEACFCRN